MWMLRWCNNTPWGGQNQQCTDDKRSTEERLFSGGNQNAASRCRTLVDVEKCMMFSKCMMFKKLHFLLFPIPAIRLVRADGKAYRKFALIRIWQSRCLRGARPFRPVTLRIHLSMSLPFSDSVFDLALNYHTLLIHVKTDKGAGLEGNRKGIGEESNTEEFPFLITLWG